MNFFHLKRGLLHGELNQFLSAIGGPIREGVI
jgi:hypothetical protein